MQTKNVVVYIPMTGGFKVHRNTFIDYIQMKNYVIGNQQFLPFKLGTFFEYYPSTYPIDAMRDECAHRTIEGIKMGNGSYIKPDITIWLDMDQTFPVDAMFKLLKHELPIVCGIYHLKAREQGKAFFPVIFKRGTEYEKRRMFKPIVEYPEDELFEIDFTGMGCVRIDASVFSDISKDPKHHFFDYTSHPADGPQEDSQWKFDHDIRDTSEDRYFWDQVIDKTDYKVMCDSSIQCGHIGEMVYNKHMYDSFMEQHREMYIKMHSKEEYDKRWATVYKVEKSSA